MLLFRLTLMSLTLSASSACVSLNDALIEKSVTIDSFNRDDVRPRHDVATIWVHGTGQNPLLHKFHTSPAGLLRHRDIPSSYGLKNVGTALDAHDMYEFHQDDFYTFGWSGKLSFAAREVAGKGLINALRTVHAQHEKQYGIKPRLRVVTHSHGCNVVLNAADHLPNESFCIDELVLLACPVQQQTAAKIASPSFKKIFALYSSFDLTQIIDPQGLNSQGADSGGKLFSERRFVPQPNLVHAQIRWRGFGLTHAGFVRERFGKALPSILAALRPAQEDELNPPQVTDYVIDIVGS